MDAKVPLRVALLGGKVRIPTVDGDVELTISPGTQPGERQIMRKKGVARVRSSERGDQIITIKVEMPKTLTDRQKELLIEAFGTEEEKKKAPSDANESTKSGCGGTKKGFFDGIFASSSK